MSTKDNKKVAIIGAGFSGLSAASYLAKEGYEVSVFEKKSIPGGRARQYKQDGFTFDMGPTWYWMPSVFDKFFHDFEKKTSDYYHLLRLDPGYKVYFGVNDYIDISAKLDEVCAAFENEEVGSSTYLKKFLTKAEYNYQIAMDNVVYKPGKSPFDGCRRYQFKRRFSGNHQKGRSVFSID